MRFRSLDALRGFAALIVVLYHAWASFPFEITHISYHGMSTFENPWAFVRFTPLRVLISGTSVVILFFVLSGFALSIMMEGVNYRYLNYLVRRFCRIYIPFFLAICFAAILCWLFFGVSHPAASDWFFRDNWVEKPTFRLLMGHFLMLGSREFESLDGVIWSLVHELRISIIFPLIYFACKRHTTAALLVSLGIYLMSSYVMLGKAGLGWSATVFDTLQYVLFFVIGCAIAQRRDYLQRIFCKVSFGFKFMILILGVCAFGFTPGIPLASSLVFGIASSLLIAIAISSPRMESFLSAGLFQWLGRISYSLYLVHVPIMLAFTYALAPWLGHWWILFLSIVASFSVATVSFYLIERNSIRIGNNIGRLV